MLKKVVSSVMLKEATPEKCRSQSWTCNWKIRHLLSNLYSKCHSRNV